MPGASPLLETVRGVELTFVRGEGVWLIDSQGKRYLDLYGGHAVTGLGHSHPHLEAALHRQASQLIFQSVLFDLEVRRRAAARLLAFGPEGMTRVFFVNSGAEANENALRIAFLATRRREVVSLKGGFHGRSAAASAVTSGSEAWYAFPRHPFVTRTARFDDPASLEELVTEETAAVILEPIQGLAGARPVSPEFLHAARSITARRGALLIFDEVQCGMGRTGWPFAAQAFGILPDLLTTAKGLGGGFPVGAVLLREGLERHVAPGDLGSTFGGGPLAAAMVVAVIEAIESGRLLSRVRSLSQQIRNACVVGPVTAIQGMGFLLGFRTTRPALEIVKELRERGILAGTSHDPSVLRILPPLVLEESHIENLRSALEDIAP